MGLDIKSIRSDLPVQPEMERMLSLIEKLSESGLILSEKQAIAIAEARSASLASNGRIKFAGKT